jgi:hypothetical protein
VTFKDGAELDPLYIYNPEMGILICAIKLITYSSVKELKSWAKQLFTAYGRKTRLNVHALKQSTMAEVLSLDKNTKTESLLTPTFVL